MSEHLWLPNTDLKHFKNPVIHADYSDPDVIALGDRFYLTASSFQYTPGLPILSSRNLVDWELISYALAEIPEERYRLPQVSQGVWAPSIRFYKNEVWIFYGMPDEGIFAVRAPRPEGPWSKPILIRRGKGLIDPCPYWDEEGNGYVVHAFAKSRIGFKSVLAMFCFMKNGEPYEGEDILIYEDHENQPTMEGPKVYRRGSYFYIFAPAGGVTHGWQTVLRGPSLEGPFEARVVLRQGDTEVNGPHQGAWIRDVKGQDWFIHFRETEAYGRITYLEPMRWVDGWPVIGQAEEGAEFGVPVPGGPLPAAVEPVSKPLSLEASDDFSEDALGLQWQWYGNPPKDAFEMDGGLRLFAQNADLAEAFSLWNKPNLLTQKLISPEAFYTLELDGSKLGTKDAAGLAVLGDSYMSLSLQGAGGRRLRLVRAEAGAAEEELAVLEVKDARQTLFLDVFIEEGTAYARLGFLNEEGQRQFFDPKLKLKRNTWTGPRPSIFCITKQHPRGGSALFLNFRAEPREDLA